MLRKETREILVTWLSRSPDIHPFAALINPFVALIPPSTAHVVHLIRPAFRRFLPYAVHAMWR